MTPSATETIKTSLQSEEITEVAIVDDAYDVPTLDSFRGEIDDFWAEIERDEEMRNELKTLNLDIERSEDIDDAAIKILWEQREQLDKLKSPCDKTLFDNKLQQISEITGLCAYLEELGLNVIKLGTEDDVQELVAKLVFMDYYFEDRDDATAGQIALSKVKDILKKAAGSDKPFIVLMSAKGDVTSLVDKFCDESGILKGLFDFVPKSKLNTKAMLYLKLSTWAIGMPIRYKIQHFVDALEKSVNDASKIFVQKVRRLGLEDYAYIQLLSLQEEGHPLGQYMLWLFGSLLSNIAFEANDNVQGVKKIVDKLRFGQFLPSQRPPSIQLAETYRIALSEPANELKYHTVIEGETTPSTHLPDLGFGDLLIKDASNKVWMVANGPCDLIRPTDPNRSILLIPGTLRPLHERNADSENIRTELFEHDNRQYCIVWDHKNFFSKRYGDIKDWIDTEGCSRIARLRFPFALQIQQKFATHLTRVEQPISPPIYEFVDVESYCEGEDGNCQILQEPIKDGAFITRLRKKDCVIFTTGCVEALFEAFDTVIEQYQRKISLLDTKERGYQTRKTRLQTKLQNLKGYRENYEIFEIPKKEWQLDKSKQITLKDRILCMYLNDTFDGPYASRPPICLNIKYVSVSQVTNGSQPDANLTSKTGNEVTNG